MTAKTLRGSAGVSFTPIQIISHGIGCFKFQSITAMQEYNQFCFEEIRLEDYDASCGLFGSAIASIGGLLCAPPHLKRKPSKIGKLYQQAIDSRSIYGIKFDGLLFRKTNIRGCGELSITPTKLFEYSNTSLQTPLVPQNPLREMTLSVARTQFSFIDSDVIDVHMKSMANKLETKNYTIEGYQPTSKGSYTSIAHENTFFKDLAESIQSKQPTSDEGLKTNQKENERKSLPSEHNQKIDVLEYEENRNCGPERH